MNKIVAAIFLLFVLPVYSQDTIRLDLSNNYYIPYTATDGNYKILIYDFMSLKEATLTATGKYVKGKPDGIWKLTNEKNELVYTTYFDDGIIYKTVQYKSGGITKTQDKVNVKTKNYLQTKVQITRVSFDGRYEQNMPFIDLGSGLGYTDIFWED